MVAHFYSVASVRAGEAELLETPSLGRWAEGGQKGEGGMGPQKGRKEGTWGQWGTPYTVQGGGGHTVQTVPFRRAVSTLRQRFSCVVLPVGFFTALVKQELRKRVALTKKYST